MKVRYRGKRPHEREVFEDFLKHGRTSALRDMLPHYQDDPKSQRDLQDEIERRERARS